MSEQEEQDVSEEQFLDLKSQLEAAVEAAEQSGERDHAEIAECYQQLGIIENMLDGDPLVARKNFRNAVDIFERILPAGEPTLVRSYCDLAMSEISLEETDSAKEWIAKADQIVRKNRLQNDPALITFYTARGFIERSNDELDAANASFEKAYALAQQFLEPNDPEWIQHWSNLAMIRQDLNDHQGAKEMLCQAITALRQEFGDEHPDLPSFYAGLATSEHMLGHYKEAKQLFEKVLARELEMYGEEDPNPGLTYHNLAETEKELGHLEAAISNSRHAFEIFFNLDHELAEDELTWLSENDPQFDQFMATLKERLARQDATLDAADVDSCSMDTHSEGNDHD